MEMSPMVTQEPTGHKMATQMWVRTDTLLLPKVLRTMDTGRSTAMATAMTRWIPTGWTVDKAPHLTGTTPDTMGTLHSTMATTTGTLPRLARFLLSRGTVVSSSSRGSLATSTTTTCPTAANNEVRRVARLERELRQDGEHPETRSICPTASTGAALLSCTRNQDTPSPRASRPTRRRPDDVARKRPQGRKSATGGRDRPILLSVIPPSTPLYIHPSSVRCN